MVVGDEGFEFEGVPLFDGVFFEVEKVYNLWSVLGNESAGVAYVVTLVKTVARSALTVAVLLVVAGGHVGAVDEVAAVHFAEVTYLATGDAADVTVFVGIAQSDVAGEYFVKFADEGLL